MSTSSRSREDAHAGDAESGGTHFHIWSLPKKYYPRTHGNKAKEYSQDITRLYKDLSQLLQKLVHSAEVAKFCIKSLNKKMGYYSDLQETFKSVEEFIYHYENYCFRIYVLREKFLHFINEVMPIGFTDKEVHVQPMLMNRDIKRSGLFKEIEKFKDNTSLGKLISNRKALTHGLAYGKEVDSHLRPEGMSSLADWSRQVTLRTNLAIQGMHVISDINHTVCNKIIEYKDRS